MKRFQTAKQPSGLRNIFLSVCVFFLLIFCFSYGIQIVSETADRTEIETLERAVKRNVVQCYAAEGRYPESLKYLEEHYPLRYDKEKYFIGYEVLGENIMPDITIISRKD
ncbi:MAG: hypothetical protein U0M58_04885 [Blautia sp.]|jgi:hypothetical protein|nr:hypothetical protein [Blautia sp.]